INNSTLNLFADQPQQCLFMQRKHESGDALIFFNFGNEPATSSMKTTGLPWRKLLDSADERWLGPGSTFNDSLNTKVKIILQPKSCCVFQNASLIDSHAGLEEESALRHGF